MTTHSNRVVEKRFKTGQVELNYAEGPDTGAPMVLIHGLSGRWQSWSPIIPDLTTRWHVYAVDLRGHGRSSHVPDAYLFADYAPDIEAFLERVVGTPAVLIGHSLGGMTAIGVAAQAPQTLQAVVLEDPPMFVTERPEHSAFRERFAESRNLARSSRSGEEIYEKLRKTQPEAEERFLRERVACLWALDPEVFTPAIDGRAAEGFDVDEKLRAITAPVLLLQGNPELGGAVGDGDAERTMAALRNGTLAKFQYVGHGIHSERPEETLKVVEQFLDRVLSDARTEGYV